MHGIAPVKNKAIIISGGKDIATQTALIQLLNHQIYNVYQFAAEHCWVICGGIKTAPVLVHDPARCNRAKAKKYIYSN